jgi:outer membrane protein insertion porin family
MNWPAKKNVVTILAVSSLLSICPPAAFVQVITNDTQSSVVVRKVNFQYGVGLADAPMQTAASIFQNRIFRESQLQDEAAEVVRNVFQKYGYLDATVDRPSVEAALNHANPSSVDLGFHIQPGSEYRLSDLIITNSRAYSLQELRGLLRLQVGDVFSIEDMRVGLAALRHFYRCRGYIEFSAVPSVERNHVAHTVRLTIDVDEGEPYTLGTVQLLGSDHGLIASLLSSPELQTGRPYSSCEMEHVFEALRPALPVDARPQENLRATINDDRRTIDLVFDFRSSRQETSSTAH